MVEHYLSKTWEVGGNGCFTEQNERYINLFEEHLGDFSGSILEIGPGTSKFAKYILETRPVTNYTILDIERHLSISKKLLSEFSNVNFVASYEYEKVFENSYDLMISIQCLSETPLYFSKNIYDNIKCKSSFILDGKDECPHYNKMLQEFSGSFPSITVVQTDMYHSDSQKLYFGSGKKL